MSGGEAGARHGPSLMPGGRRAAWHRVQPLLEAAAAHVDGEPCAAYLGPGACGHYVKMVHNGIEYGLMQLIAESLRPPAPRPRPRRRRRRRDLRALERQPRCAATSWRSPPASSTRQDDRTGQPLVDLIADAAGQKGTGIWTSQEALDLQVPIPVIDIAVTMRDLSGDTEVRGRVGARCGRHRRPLAAPAAQVVADLGGGLRAAIILTYAQGFALLQRGSRQHGFDLDLATIARLWRGGCIIRADVLADDPRRLHRGPRPAAPARRPTPSATRSSRARPPCARRCVTAIAAGLPVPALAACLGYLDAYRAERLPTNLIQAQRDYFGAHTYRRLDDDDVHHTAWEDPS